jgi:hypothetical protein
MMLQRLVFHHSRYGTKPRIERIGTDEGAYKDDEIFLMWEEELAHVNRDIQERLRNGVYSIDERFLITYKNLLNGVRENEKSVSALPGRYRKLRGRMKDSETIVYPLFDLKLSAGDLKNNAAIGMGIFGQRLPPYPEMHDKLVLRDKRYNTG